MAQQQQNITISAPGFYGINTEDSPLTPEVGYCTLGTNCVVDQLGRIGARKAWAEDTTAINVVFTPAPGAVSESYVTHTIGTAVVGGTREILTIVSVTQVDGSNVELQSDYFLCKSVARSGTFELDEISLPTLTTPENLKNAQILAFNEKVYILSKGNDIVVYDGTSATALSQAAGFLPPQDDTGTIATTINGDVGCAAYGRLWVSGVNNDYQTIYYSDLLLPTQWYDGKAVPTDAQNTSGIIDVAQYWPNGVDRIVGIEAHNGFLFIFGRQSILVYTGASADPADAGGLELQDAIPNIGLVSRDATTNIGSDLLFVDDSGIRSAGRTIQEKSVPMGDLTLNVRRDVTQVIAKTADKSEISLDYWASEGIVVLLFPSGRQAYVMETSMPSPSGGLKVTRWTDCRFNRSVYLESEGEALIFLAANQDNKGMLRYDGYMQYDNQPYEMHYQSMFLNFGQPANFKFLKQIDFTLAATEAPSTAYAGWGYDVNSTDRVKLFIVDASPAALYDEGKFSSAKFGAQQSTVRRYKINTKGSGENVVIGLRVDIAGNSCSLQEINVQTLLGRIH